MNQHAAYQEVLSGVFVDIFVVNAIVFFATGFLLGCAAGAFFVIKTRPRAHDESGAHLSATEAGDNPSK